MGRIGETMIPLYVFVFPSCGKIELYATDDLKQKSIRIVNAVKP